MPAFVHVRAAPVGAVIVPDAIVLDIRPMAPTIVGGRACLALRWMALRQGRYLPAARLRSQAMRPRNQAARQWLDANVPGVAFPKEKHR